jgi:hypothetical protein
VDSCRTDSVTSQKTFSYMVMTTWWFDSLHRSGHCPSINLTLIVQNCLLSWVRPPEHYTQACLWSCPCLVGSQRTEGIAHRPFRAGPTPYPAYSRRSCWHPWSSVGNSQVGLHFALREVQRKPERHLGKSDICDTHLSRILYEVFKSFGDWV